MLYCSCRFMDFCVQKNPDTHINSSLRPLLTFLVRSPPNKNAKFIGESIAMRVVNVIKQLQGEKHGRGLELRRDRKTIAMCVTNAKTVTVGLLRKIILDT